MRPSELRKHGIPPSEAVKVEQGCILAFVDKPQSVSHTKTTLDDDGSFYEATAPHLHFEIRVPRIGGFQNVSPYWTVVHSHRFRLTGSFTSPAASDRPCGKRQGNK
jgi:hypothetical protein